MVNKPLVTILTPTYNDLDYLGIMLESIQSQTYVNWQHIIVNDGSTDETQLFLEGVSDSRIKILNQENGDQLNALMAASEFIAGELVCMLHSDDVFVSSSTLQKNVEAFFEGETCDGIVGDFTLINKSGIVEGIQKSLLPQELSITDIFYTYGCNFVGDPFFVKRDIFDDYVKKNYLERNTFYYLKNKTQPFLKLKRVESWYSYRIFSENYINSDVGKFVALLGQFRTIRELYSLGYQFGVIDPTYSYFVFRLARKLRINLPIVKKQEMAANQMSRFFDLFICELKRLNYPQILLDIAHEISVSSSKKNGVIQESSVAFKIIELPKKFYCPRDGRQFFKDFESGTLDVFYSKFLNEDFDYIECLASTEEFTKELLDFFSFSYEIKVV